MEARRRLRSVTARAAADPAEVAFAVSAFHHRELDVPTLLLRVDALADLVRTADGADEGDDAAAVLGRLRQVLGEELAYRGAPGRPRRADDAHLHVVLDERHGLPVTLSALWVAVARRVGLTAFVVNLPGHVVAAIGSPEHPEVLDPFAGGRPLDEEGLRALVDRATGGRVAFTRSMVRPATPAELARRILTNLTIDLTREQHAGAAVWTVVARLALPDPDPRDHVVLGQLLERSGRFDRAAQAYDRYTEAVPDAADADQVRAKARRARARTN